jgi:hypothetical protein
VITKIIIIIIIQNYFSFAFEGVMTRYEKGFKPKKEYKKIVVVIVMVVTSGISYCALRQ